MMNSKGNICFGGAGFLSVDGVVVYANRCTNPGWLTDTVIVGQFCFPDGSWGIGTLDISVAGAVPVVLINAATGLPWGGANNLMAANGTWFAEIDNASEDVFGVWSNGVSLVLPGAGLQGLDRTGTSLLITPVRLGATGLVVKQMTGPDITIDTGGMLGIGSCIDLGVVAWAVGTTVHSTSAPAPLTLPNGNPNFTTLSDGRKFFVQDVGAGVVVYQWNTTTPAGFILNTGIGTHFDFYPQISPLGGSVVRVSSSHGQGQLPTDVQAYDLDVDARQMRSAVMSNGTLTWTAYGACPIGNMVMPVPPSTLTIPANLQSVASYGKPMCWYTYFAVPDNTHGYVDATNAALHVGDTSLPWGPALAFDGMVTWDLGCARAAQLKLPVITDFLNAPTSPAQVAAVLAAADSGNSAPLSQQVSWATTAALAKGVGMFVLVSEGGPAGSIPARARQMVEAYINPGEAPAAFQARIGAALATAGNPCALVIGVDDGGGIRSEQDLVNGLSVCDQLIRQYPVSDIFVFSIARQGTLPSGQIVGGLTAHPVLWPILQRMYSARTGLGSVPAPLTPDAPPVPTVTDTLTSGSELSPNQSLTSPNGLYTAVLQGAGNLVVYGPNTAVMFATPIGGQTLAMQTAGNVVLYGVNGTVVWAAGPTPLQTGTVLKVSNTGTLDIVNTVGQVVWTTGAPAPVVPPPAPVVPKPVVPAPVVTKSSGTNPLIYVAIVAAAIVILYLVTR